jgi:tRNA1(Val) A37 N6-methylase TrmN6
MELSEIREQEWFPGSLRDNVTDELQFILGAGKIYEPVSSLLAQAIKLTGAQRLLDLCSGAGRPWVWLSQTLARENIGQLEICLTDKYPNIAAFEHARQASRGTISYCSESVDAARLPRRLQGFRNHV